MTDVDKINNILLQTDQIKQVNIATLHSLNKQSATLSECVNNTHDIKIAVNKSDGLLYKIESMFSFFKFSKKQHKYITTEYKHSDDIIIDKNTDDDVLDNISHNLRDILMINNAMNRKLEIQNVILDDLNENVENNTKSIKICRKRIDKLSR